MSGEFDAKINLRFKPESVEPAFGLKVGDVVHISFQIKEISPSGEIVLGESCGGSVNEECEKVWHLTNAVN